jgi:S-(hydroxymethyl)glutathione dehydrogenase/alcohol dehydrogenase
MGQLMRMIEEGKADPSQIITHTLPLSEAARGYDIFTHRKENCVKVLLKPQE